MDVIVESHHQQHEQLEVDHNNGLSHNHNNSHAANFSVGVESSPELVHELRFSIANAHRRISSPGTGNNESESGPGPPTSFSVGCGDEGGGMSFEPLADEDDDLVIGTIIWDDDGEEDLAQMMAIHRVDSRDVVFDNRAKKVKVLGKYVMGDVLGEGSYAKVKEAIDQETLCRRAVKIMKRKKLRKIPRGEENVEREIKLVSGLRHPNIMRLIEVFYNDEKGKIYMVLEYCCAVLKDMLEESPMKKFPTWQAHYYFCQLIHGMEYLQSHRIVHKDIKPGNLLLDTAGVLKIADFGVAEQLNLFATDDTIRTSQGTPAFQPPEVANGVERFPGFKLDIWSCGVTLFNFATGAYPFEGDTIFRLFEAIGRGDFTVPKPEVDTVLEALIRGMLHHSFEERFSLQQVKEHDWVRKRYPCNAPPVTVKARGDDPTLSTTVIPYLYNLHFDAESDYEGEEQVISEHELRQQQQQQQPDEDDVEEGTSVGNGQKKEKRSKCLKVRKLGGCVVV